ncbi:hypothetical protein SIL11_04050 [Scandinavium sp. V105_1]|uniref:Uncharacterized protein n=1 Tax=Scandinavium lactucae TaxID=3095028 RepID=A0ABU4QJW0_9ENTR|nr:MULTISPECIES: hypothetical protein [unclassified Scandinavium]MDX6038694.1 hypothetical protein [Scandinavium sp. V105_6]MDX6049350.1 hypothetical protein [Scandinavium sp. V105_1]
MTATELFFMVFVMTTANHFGVKDITAIAALYSGVNNQTTRAKPKDAIPGTSRVSKRVRGLLKNTMFPCGIKMPTWIGGYTPWTVERRMVRKVSTFVARTIPLIGEVVLAADVSQIAYCSVRDYNAIARGSDKLW